VALSAVGTVLLYGVPILAILLVLPADRVTSIGGFLDAIKEVFTVYGGTVSTDGTVSLNGAGQWLGNAAAIAFVLSLASSGTTWLMGADRALAIAACDGSGPRFLGHFSDRFGTPVTANILSGAVSTAVMVLAFTLTRGNAKEYFSAVLGLAISTTTISYLAVFPAAIALRKRFPDTPRPYRIPGGDLGVAICSGLATLWALIATVCLLWPGFGVGWFGSTGIPDDSLPEGFSHRRLDYELTQLLPLVFFILMGVLFWVLGSRTRKESSDSTPANPDLIAR
jgi:amino acid transporter